MSMMGGPPAAGSTEVGETVASFAEYQAAQKAVSKLIAADIAARDIAIVGWGLRSIERVTGKLGYATAARSGAINGMLIGLFFAAILVLGSPALPIQAFVGVLFVGIAVGMLLSLITYSFVRRRRDYASVMQVVADHYEVTVASRSIHRAREILGRAGIDAPPAARSQPAAHSAPVGTPPAPVPAPAPDLAEPPRYGERVAPSGTQPEPSSPPAADPGDERPPE